MKRSVHFSLSALGALAALVPASALAQDQSGPAQAPAPAPAPGPAPAPATPYTPPAGGVQVGYGAPSSGPIGGGNATDSSSRPITGSEEDSFDLGAGRGAGGTMHGDENGPVFMRGGIAGGGEVPQSHLVRRGDTLWGLCDQYFQNPYQWPRVWSYNPQIKNPNWIYPGDEVRLKAPGTPESAATPPPGMPSAYGGLVDRRRQVPVGTVFLRDEGWIHDKDDQVWGDLTGAAEDKMFLTDLDEVYLHLDKGHDVQLGQELTVFKPVKSANAGTLVQIEGTVRVDQWDAQDRIARAEIVETLGNPIERGARIGPLARRFEIVPPRRDDVDVQAHVLASIHPEVFWGQNQVVFIDKGEDAGLKPGNRLFILRRGDFWRQTLVTASSGYRVSPEDSTRAPPIEKTPGSPHDEKLYPDEVTGELRVVAVRKDTATCLVTESKLEIEPHDLAVARKGY